jgi:hypothetical protein
MKNLKPRKMIERYENLTESDKFGLGITITAARAGHKSQRNATKNIDKASAELKREETLLLIEHRKDEANKAILTDARTEYNQTRAESAANKFAPMPQSLSPMERDHVTLYQLSPEYHEAYEALQVKHEPLITHADQLDAARRVKKWDGDAIGEDEKWKGGESLETVRAVLFDGLDDSRGLVPAYLDADGNDLEEDGELETVAGQLSDALNDAMEELETQRNDLITELSESPEAPPVGEKAPFNANTPVLVAYKAFGFDLGKLKFGIFKRRCLEGVAHENAADVTDVAQKLYSSCEELKTRREKILADHDQAVIDAGLQSTGYYTQHDQMGKEIRVAFAGMAYSLALGFWIVDLSHRAQRAYEKKSRRGTTGR